MMWVLDGIEFQQGEAAARSTLFAEPEPLYGRDVSLFDFPASAPFAQKDDPSKRL